jgi:hypothetical protein
MLKSHPNIGSVTLALRATTLFAIAATAPLHAETGKSQMTVGVQPTPAPSQFFIPEVSYPYPILPLHARPKVRCEQDRLLTGATPCGDETAEPLVIVPKKKKRCEMDRLITDTTPCER